MKTHQEIQDAFPELLSECWDFSPPVGWGDLVYDLCEKLSKIAGVKAHQVKSKFAGLRFYTNFPNDEADRLIADAEHLSFKTCEDCGNIKDEVDKRSTSRHGWIRSVCIGCCNKRMEAK
jgi:hypothetical protein